MRNYILYKYDVPGTLCLPTYTSVLKERYIANNITILGTNPDGHTSLLLGPQTSEKKAHLLVGVCVFFFFLLLYFVTMR